MKRAGDSFWNARVCSQTCRQWKNALYGAVWWRPAWILIEVSLEKDSPFFLFVWSRMNYFVTKLNLSLLLHYVSQIQRGFSETAVDIWKRKLKSALAGKQKEPKGNKKMLNLKFEIWSFFFFPSSPPAAPCCLEITVVQFSLGDGGVTGRGEVRGRQKVQGCKISLQHNQHISGCCFICMYILHYAGSPAYRKVAVISLPKLFFSHYGAVSARLHLHAAPRGKAGRTGWDHWEADMLYDHGPLANVSVT